MRVDCDPACNNRPFRQIFRRRAHSRKVVREVLRSERTDVFRVRQRSLEVRLPWFDAQWDAGVGIEGSNATHLVFRCAEAVVHQGAPTRVASVVRATMDGHRSAVWLADRTTAQQGHAAAHRTCLAHLARDVAYALENSDDPYAGGCSSD